MHFHFNTLNTKVQWGIGNTSRANIIFAREGNTYKLWAWKTSMNNGNLGNAYEITTTNDFIIKITSENGSNYANIYNKGVYVTKYQIDSNPLTPRVNKYSGYDLDMEVFIL